MTINKISAYPPNKNEKTIEEFISEAEEKKKETTTNKLLKKIESLPWENSLVRKDVQKAFTIKLPEEYILKIKYFSEKTNKSQQRIIREIISKEIDKLISEIN